ncbi:MAG: hypothetical protein WCO56_11420 [Verrucomicrobiota bacterium]
MRARSHVRFSPTVILLVLAVASLLLAGCRHRVDGFVIPKSEPKRYNIEVVLANNLQNRSVVVDLVPVNAANLERWRTYSMTQYWQREDPMRANADKATFSFVKSASQQTLKQSDDAKWSNWMKTGAQYVLVLADLPGSHADMPGNQDARRQILPLDINYWLDKPIVLHIKVQESGVLVTTPTRPGMPRPIGW